MSDCPTFREVPERLETQEDIFYHFFFFPLISVFWPISHHRFECQMYSLWTLPTWLPPLQTIQFHSTIERCPRFPLICQVCHCFCGPIRSVSKCISLLQTVGLLWLCFLTFLYRSWLIFVTSSRPPGTWSKFVRVHKLKMKKFTYLIRKVCFHYFSANIIPYKDVYRGFLFFFCNILIFTNTISF